MTYQHLATALLGDFWVVMPPFLQDNGGLDDSFIAFTTLAHRCCGRMASFREGTEDSARFELGDAIAPVSLSWLSLEHGALVALPPYGNRTVRSDACAADRADARAADCAAHCADARAADRSVDHANARADAAIVDTSGTAVAFTTADCLPIILASKSHVMIAGIHAGWRGIARGVIENCCLSFAKRCGGQMPADTQAWIGPAIKAADFEVSTSTRTELMNSPSVKSAHFSLTRPGHYLADLLAMSVAKLKASGIALDNITSWQGSTFSDLRCHSARRDGESSGRMATVIGLR
ncbi:MAG: polyphenol oxidase family protein [Coriobacteriia bacterium]|nr:polyphenol oxidase family protein [Coriobacteriia bacterium]